MAIRCEMRDCKFNKEGFCQADGVEIGEDMRCYGYVGKRTVTTVYGKVEGEFLTIDGIKTVNILNLLKEFEGKKVLIIIVEEGDSNGLQM